MNYTKNLLREKMNKKESLQVDVFNAEEVLKVLPVPPYLSSKGLDWGELNLQVYGSTPPWETPIHYSSTMHGIAILIGSHPTIERQLGGKRQPDPGIMGEIIIHPVNTEHWCAWRENLKGFIVLGIPACFINQIAYETVNPERVELLPQFSRPDPLIYQIGLALKSELESASGADVLYVESLTKAISMHLLKHYASRQTTLWECDDGLPPYKLRQALDYMHAHLKENIKIADIAATVHMSHFYFCRLFRQSMGVTPYQYIIQQRVELAQQLLKQRRELSIANISLECGFTNQSHFAKSFRRIIGTTPKKYRDKS